MRVIEVEDEQAEARYVAAQIAGLVEDGFSGSEIAIFYRMNAQSRVIEQTLRLHQIAYQVIGGPRFYERAEVKDAIAYLQVLDNPDDAVSLMRIANKPKRGIGDTTISRLVSYAEAHGISLFDALDRPSEAGLGTAAVKAVTGLKNLLDSLRSAAQEFEVPELLQEVLARSGTLEAYEAERTIEARGRIENLEAFVDGAREYVQQSEEPTLSGFLQEISLYSDQDALDERAVERDADDDPQREGPRVPGRLRRRGRGGDLPERPLDRGAGGGGGAPPLLRRPDAGRGEADADARLLAPALGPDDRSPAVPLPRRAARPPRRARAAAALLVAELRHARADARHRSRGADHPALSTGDSVRHGTLGEGVITRIEPGGVVTVRFADDGSERKLMLDYAPLEKIV